jgi:phosphoribosyl-ATP pyrophosphohydrolase
MSSPSILRDLEAVITDRKGRPEDQRSYVASLLRGGLKKVGGKVLEEAREVVDAAAESGPEGKAHLAHEVADLIFHTLVLMGSVDLPWSDVEDELERRFGISGIEEKAARKKSS